MTRAALCIAGLAVAGCLAGCFAFPRTMQAFTELPQDAWKPLELLLLSFISDLYFIGKQIVDIIL